ncbi:MAG: hypothetical protein GY754_15830 [bacterium]|nr:hypothetical protein [bacterium]
MKLNPFKKTQPSLPKIYRKQIIEGVSIPGIIHNSSYYFVDFEVYEDGRVNCWNFEDFDHFKKDVHRGWVITTIPDGEAISIHGLGAWKLQNGNWDYTGDSFIEYVLSIIKNLNPKMENIYKYSKKQVNGITIGENGGGTIYKEDGKFANSPFAEKIKGEGTNLFYQTAKGKFVLVRLDAYPDSTITINRLPKPINIDIKQLEKMIAKGTIQSEVPENSTVKINGLGSFTVLEAQYVIGIEDKLSEIKNAIRVLNGEPSLIEVCSAIYEEYIKKPGPKLKEELKISYENIPTHERMYVGDMDIKDTAVRMIIYGEKEIENWSHYQAAKAEGMELPTIKIPETEEDE